MSTGRLMRIAPGRFDEYSSWPFDAHRACYGMAIGLMRHAHRAVTA